MKQSNDKLWFTQPAINCIDATPEKPSQVNASAYLGETSDLITALPIGNGRIGGLIYGGISEELIKLNEETLWSGEPKENNDLKWVEHLPEVRRLIDEEKFEDADLCAMKMQGPYNESYQPLGNLRLKFHHDETVDKYVRELCLSDATAYVRYDIEQVHYEREYFCSHQNNVLAIQLSANQQGKITFDLTLDSALVHSCYSVDEDRFILEGKAPSHVDPNYFGEVPNAIVYDVSEQPKGMTFEVHVKATISGGQCSCDDEGIHITSADAAYIILTASTSYNGWDKSPSSDGAPCHEICLETMNQAIKKGFNNLRLDHLTYFHRYFKRVKLSLSTHELEHRSYVPTNERLKAFQRGDKDLGMYELFFNYGRYLMMTSSLNCVLPSNLQGIWNEEVRPPWSDNWTANINVQMNYWPAEVCNLSECHQPLLQLIDHLRDNGRKTAKTYYGARGWLSGGNIDIWHTTNPVGNGTGTPTWANWLMSGPWLCQHIWLHYAYTMDKNYLETIGYPIMKECAEFILDILVEDKDGFLVTSPSSSPERTFTTADGQIASLSAGTTMDMTLIRELFTNIIQATEILYIDSGFAQHLRKTIERLYPFRIGRLGQLQEWSNDWDDPELIDSHCSFLYGLYPGYQITPEKTPDLAKAADISLRFRGMCLQGWGLGWRICLWARLKNADKSLEALDLLIGKLLAPNLMCKIYPSGVFQIDGNFGGMAGIAEMLIQSQPDEISILPALPREWSKGSVKGLKAFGGFELNIEWNHNKVSKVKVISTNGGICRIRISTLQEKRMLRIHKSPANQSVSYVMMEKLIYFATEKGGSYDIVIDEL